MCWLVLLVVHQPAICQQVVENRTISMSEQFSSGASVMVGPDVTMQSPAAVSFNARLVGFRGPVVIMGSEVVVTPDPVSSVTSNEGPGIAYTFALDQNYPNPFSGETEIGFSLEASGHVEIAVYNVLGKRIRTLTSGVRETGLHSVRWDGRGDSGQEAASGVYYYILNTGDRKMTRQMILAR